LLVNEAAGAGPNYIDPARLDWSSLEAAFCYRAPDCRAFLRLATGQVPVIRDARLLEILAQGLDLAVEAIGPPFGGGL